MRNVCIGPAVHQTKQCLKFVDVREEKRCMCAFTWLFFYIINFSWHKFIYYIGLCLWQRLRLNFHAEVVVELEVVVEELLGW